MAFVISFANRKGGVAKTTSCLNIAYWLADQSKRVLMIDNDSQGNLTEFFSYNTDNLEDRKKTVYSAYVDGVPLDTLVLRDNPALVPASDQLSDIESVLVQNAFINRSTILRDRIKQVGGEYDFVLIDCPPWLNVLTVNALAASNAVLIPMATDRFATNGVVRLLRIVHDVRKMLNPDLSILGILPTRFNPQYTNDKRNLATVRSFAASLDVRVFDPINRSTAFNSEVAENTPPEAIRPDAETVALYAALGKEILAHG
jgi:chromosome partitioning protein